MPRSTIRASVSLALIVSSAMLAAPVEAATSQVRLLPILGGYTRPVVIAHAPGEGRTMYIAEQGGLIKRATYADGTWTPAGTFLDLRALVNQTGNERGLLGLAFHPHYERNGRFYVNYTRQASGGDNGDTIVAEYRRGSDGLGDPASGRRVLLINQPYANHNGGQLLFGPDDYLYISSGDGGSGGDPHGNGQRLDTLLGKLLRIDPIDPDGSGPKRYRVPRSNPLVGRKGRDAIWAWGLRNPWRLSFDRVKGDLWIGDVGQLEVEEVDRSRANRDGRNAGKGRNYGWNRCEGTRRYPDTSLRCRFGVRPVYAYRHVDDTRCYTVTGGYVHRGPAASTWRGLYVGADYCTGRLFILGSKGGLRFSRNTNLHISTFGEDHAGRIFAADRAGGTIYLVRFSGPRP